MKVSELQGKQGNVEIELKVKEISEPREFSKFGMVGKVANATGEDDSGEIKVTLWNDQIEQVKAGDTIKITKGYVSEWQGEKQLSTGKFGTLEVIGDDGQPKEAPAAKSKDDGLPAAAPTKSAKPKAPATVEEPEEDEDYDADSIEEEKIE